MNETRIHGRKAYRARPDRLQSWWRMPIWDDKGLLSVDDTGLLFEGKRSTIRMARPVSVRFVRARFRVIWLILVAAFVSTVLIYLAFWFPETFGPGLGSSLGLGLVIGISTAILFWTNTLWVEVDDGIQHFAFLLDGQLLGGMTHENRELYGRMCRMQGQP